MSGLVLLFRNGFLPCSEVDPETIPTGKDARNGEEIPES